MPILVIAQDMSVRIHLFSTMFLNWFKTLIVFVIGFILNLKHLITTGGYKQLFTKKNISDNLTSLSNWIQSLQNTNPEAHWLLGNIQQFVSFFISPLSLSSSRNYSLSFQQHQQLKTHFLFCIIILTFSILEIFIGMIQYGSTHNHESAKSNNEEQENIVQSFRNHGFMVSLLILFSGFYLLHRGFMFLIDLIVIYIKTTHEENTLQGSSSSVINKSSQFKTNSVPNNNNNSNTFDSPLGSTTSSLNNTSSFGDNSTLEEEGSIKRLLFQPYTYSLWKRLRVLLRFANAVFSSFLSLSIFSEMIQYVLTSKFSSQAHEEENGVGLHIPSSARASNDHSTTIDTLLDQYRVGIFTYLLVLFGLFINGLSIYLFGNYSGSSSYQAKKNEEDFLLLSSAEKRKNPSSNSSRGSVPLNRMNSSPMWYQQFSSFNSVFNTSQTTTIGRYYNTIHNYIREKIPSAKFWIYIIMREAHIHVALFIYLKAVYYSSAGIGFDFVLCCMSTMTCVFFSLPVLKANGKILLQTTPENLSNHLNSCVKEVSSMVEGVLECHSEHFWALNCSSLDEADEEDIEIDADKRKQELIATIKVRVANNDQVDHQRVLQSVRRIFCSNGLLKEHNLTVQVEKNTILGLEKIYQDDE
ncbi:predicted protein [Naegleria gruberi]|uniref:Predicted protein n=1 Tax=Naegleria gruberi TaxID=5762 RepID=D2VLR6_NAEGR|nr:uncharacterized protein NAEGRDRAFT_69874 [Naegleria gruberi]EFC42188.1 predicted protein [Naegleria gruberi]|eukprot:XP_002674932.1 predicted protein [Naegleria gruberi strain NEG-M]